MDSEAEKLRAQLESYTYLRLWARDGRTYETLEECIREAEERLRQLEHAAAPI
jgi:hypothetical protein